MLLVFGSVKIKNSRVTIFSALCFLIFLIVCIVMLGAAAPDTIEIEGESYPLTVEDDEDIEEFIEAFGYEIEGCVSDTAVTVPKTWNNTYESYQKLQKSQGLDLTPYKGKEARMLVYALCDSDELVTLLVAENRVIAAHIGSMKEDDDIRALKE